MSCCSRRSARGDPLRARHAHASSNCFHTLRDITRDSHRAARKAGIAGPPPAGPPRPTARFPLMALPPRAHTRTSPLQPRESVSSAQVSPSASSVGQRRGSAPAPAPSRHDAQRLPSAGGAYLPAGARRDPAGPCRSPGRRSPSAAGAPQPPRRRAARARPSPWRARCLLFGFIQIASEPAW